MITGLACGASPDSSRKDTVRYESISLPNTQVRHLHSNITNIDYKLYINIPAGYYHTKNKPYPALYLLDADYSFPLAKQSLEHLSDRGRINDVLLVGIGYDGPNRYRLHRTRDYTISKTLTGGYTPDIQKKSGGARKFLSFIKEELIPYIESEFYVTSSRGIAGHSFGGLFAAYSFIKEPTIFQKYIIISPSLWYDNEKILKLVSRKTNFNQKQPHRIFMAIGDKENNGSFKMIDEQKSFIKSIGEKKHSNLTLLSQVFEGFDHDTIVPAAISKGLVELYG